MSHRWSAERTVFVGLFVLLLMVGAVSTHSVTTTMVTGTLGLGCAVLSMRIVRSLAPGPVAAFIRAVSSHPLRSGSRALELAAQQMLTHTALHAPDGRLLPYPCVVVQLNPADLAEIDGGCDRSWIDTMLTSAYKAQAVGEGCDPDNLHAAVDVDAALGRGRYRVAGRAAHAGAAALRATRVLADPDSSTVRVVEGPLTVGLVDVDGGLVLQFPDRRAVVYPSGAVVGRAPGAGCVLTEPSVSWRHAALEPTPTGWSLRDLGSRNGTTVNGRRITATRLHDGDVVAFGPKPGSQARVRLS